MRKLVAIASLAVGAVFAAALLGGRSAADPGPSHGDRIVLGATSPERIVVVDVESGETTTRRVPGGTLCHGAVVVSGDRFVVNDGRPGGLLSLPIDGDGEPERLGTAHSYLESAASGRIWTTRMRYGRDARITELRETTVGGRRTYLARHPKLPSLALAGVFDGGLVFHRGRGLAVHDPRRHGHVRGLPGEQLVAAGGPRVVACDGGCRTLRVTTLGREPRTVAAPRGLAFSAGRGEVSPDGSLLAVPVASGSDVLRLAVVDLTQGTVDLVPGRLALHGALGWSRGGEVLFFAAPDGTLRSHRPRDGATTDLPVRVRGAIVDLAAG